MMTVKRLLIDIRATREAFERDEISDDGWIKSNENISNELQNLRNFKALELENKGRINSKVKHWIVRK